MRKKQVLTAVSFAVVVLLTALLFWLTQSDNSDPCAQLENDLSAAVLAENEDQSALTNRAILMRKDCAPAADAAE